MAGSMYIGKVGNETILHVGNTQNIEVLQTLTPVKRITSFHSNMVLLDYKGTSTTNWAAWSGSFIDNGPYGYSATISTFENASYALFGKQSYVYFEHGGKLYDSFSISSKFPGLCIHQSGRTYTLRYYNPGGGPPSIRLVVIYYEHINTAPSDLKIFGANTIINRPNADVYVNSIYLSDYRFLIFSKVNQSDTNWDIDGYIPNLQVVNSKVNSSTSISIDNASISAVTDGVTYPMFPSDSTVLSKLDARTSIDQGISQFTLPSTYDLWEVNLNFTFTHFKNYTGGGEIRPQSHKGLWAMTKNTINRNVASKIAIHTAVYIHYGYDYGEKYEAYIKCDGRGHISIGYSKTLFGSPSSPPWYPYGYFATVARQPKTLYSGFFTPIG